MSSMTYRGFHISEVACEPFAYRNANGPYIHPEPQYGGIEGLVRAIDAHLFVESASEVHRLLQSRRDNLAAGTWDYVNCCPKED